MNRIQFGEYEREIVKVSNLSEAQKLLQDFFKNLQKQFDAISSSLTPSGQTGKIFTDITIRTGTIQTTGAAVTGTGTLATKEFGRGTVILANGELRTVKNITDDTHWMIDSKFKADLPAGTALVTVRVLTVANGIITAGIS